MKKLLYSFILGLIFFASPVLAMKLFVGTSDELRGINTDLLGWEAPEIMGIFSTDIVPDTNNTYDVGTSALRWQDGWFAGTLTAGYFSGTMLGYISSATTTLDGMTIGGSTPAAGTFTSLSANLYTGAVATSTFDGMNIGLSTAGEGIFTEATSTYFAITGSVTSTFANGIQLTTGCFLLPSGECAGTGSGGVSASNTAYSAWNALYVGRTATSTIYGDTSTSTFSAGVQVTHLYSTAGLTVAGGLILTADSVLDAYIPNTITIDLAGTATALAADPTDCSANQFANGIAASGNLSCAAIADADVPNTITASNYLLLTGGTLSGNLNFSAGGLSTSTLDSIALGTVTPTRASSTLLSVMNTLYVGGTATTTITGSSLAHGKTTSTFYSDVSIPYRDLSVGGSTNTGFIFFGDGTATTSLKSGAPGLATSTTAGDFVIDNLYTGKLQFAQDSGLVSLADMPVSGDPNNGTIEGYTFDVDGYVVMALTALANSEGEVGYGRVGIGTMYPSSELTVVSSTYPQVKIGNGTTATSSFSGVYSADPCAVLASSTLYFSDGGFPCYCNGARDDVKVVDNATCTY